MVHKLPNECKRGNKNMTFADCELTILRSAVDKIQTNTGKGLLKEKNIQKIIEIVDKNLASFAFPSQSIYVESLPSDKPEIFNPKKKT